MIVFTQTGNFSKTKRFLEKAKSLANLGVFDKYGKIGVDALSNSTPIDSGETANSWKYEVKITKNNVSISWYNTNVVDGVQIAILLQYGHGTGTGGYVQGRDYINPAMRPVFDKIADEVWREVTK